MSWDMLRNQQQAQQGLTRQEVGNFKYALESVASAFPHHPRGDKHPVDTTLLALQHDERLQADLSVLYRRAFGYGSVTTDQLQNFATNFMVEYRDRLVAAAQRVQHAIAQEQAKQASITIGGHAGMQGHAPPGMIPVTHNPMQPSGTAPARPQQQQAPQKPTLPDGTRIRGMDAQALVSATTPLGRDSLEVKFPAFAKVVLTNEMALAIPSSTGSFNTAHIVPRVQGFYPSPHEPIRQLAAVLSSSNMLPCTAQYMLGQYMSATPLNVSPDELAAFREAAKKCFPESFPFNETVINPRSLYIVDDLLGIAKATFSNYRGFEISLCQFTNRMCGYFEGNFNKPNLYPTADTFDEVSHAINKVAGSGGATITTDIFANRYLRPMIEVLLAMASPLCRQARQLAWRFHLEPTNARQENRATGPDGEIIVTTSDSDVSIEQVTRDIALGTQMGTGSIYWLQHEHAVVTNALTRIADTDVTALPRTMVAHLLEAFPHMGSVMHVSISAMLSGSDSRTLYDQASRSIYARKNLLTFTSVGSDGNYATHAIRQHRYTVSDQAAWTWYLDNAHRL